MTSFEPPSGADDFTAQAELLEQERAQMEAERAELLAQRQARAQQRETDDLRAELEQLRAELKSERNGGPAPVIVDVDPVPAEPEEDLSDASVWDIDPDTGTAYLDEQGKPVPRWPYETIEVKGHQIQVRKAKASAGAALGILSSRHVALDKQNDATLLFCQRHTSARTFAELMDAMLDPDDEFDMPDWSEVVRQIATQDTGRPTKPSRT